MTGATGQTGSIVVHKLRDRKNEFEVVNLVRSAAKAIDKLGSKDGVGVDDITDYPEDIDYNGQKNLIDAVIWAGVEYVV